MNGLCHEVRSFHGKFIHGCFFVFESDGWMTRNRRRRRRRANAPNAINAAASTGMISTVGNMSVDALHVAPPLF
jgi:hypothetical protein